MKNKKIKKLLSIVLMLIFSMAYCQEKITGIIVDVENQPISGANIYLKNTIFGDTSDDQGQFNIILEKGQIPKEIVLIIEAIGFDTQSISLENSKDLVINLNKIILNKVITIDEVIISANSFSIGKNREVNKMNSLDVVMTGSSNGDIIGALESLPGTQKVGEDGRLYIQGGDNNELQTYIDGMHVFSPYTTNANDIPSRGRFSPFIFKGINLPLGGYELEYGQALSSVLLMDTKDLSSSSKLGINFSPLSFGGGGTLIGEHQSISFNLNYTNLGLYNKIFSDRFVWKNNYNNFSGEGQFKNVFKDKSQLKVYFGYNRTAFIREYKNINTSEVRDLDLKENNYYLNTTYQTKTKNGWSYFGGIAFSGVVDKYINARTSGDNFNEKQQEIHSKFRVKKIFNKYYKLTTGLESFTRSYNNQYNLDSNKLQQQKLNYFISAIFADNQVRLYNKFYTNISARAEYNNYNNSTVFYPRVSLDYVGKKFQYSLIYGKYFQLPENTILARTNYLHQEVANQYIASLGYENKGIALRVGAYYKKYSKLWLLKDEKYTSDGYGNSKGFDIYFADDKSIKYFKYSVSYSYNDSKRLYSNFTEIAKPSYTSKHNIRLNIKYLFPAIKTYFGLTNTFSSGRPYNNPEDTGFNQSIAPAYNSLDINSSILLNKRIILYTSLSNVFGREHIFSYRYSDQKNIEGSYNKEPIIPSRKRFFYVGIFISLKNSSAYDVSNF